MFGVYAGQGVGIICINYMCKLCEYYLQWWRRASTAFYWSCLSGWRVEEQHFLVGVEGAGMGQPIQKSAKNSIFTDFRPFWTVY